MCARKLDNITEEDIEFSVDHFLGKGSFASCHLCRQKSDKLKQDFVLKVLRPDAALPFNRFWLQKRLIREATVMHQLACEREEFVKILHLFIQNGMFSGYAMELCHNGSLRYFIQRIKSLDSKRTVFPFLTARWMLQVSDAFEYLQSRKAGPIMHRDLALDNILVTKTLDSKIADFGLTKALSGSVATANTREFETNRGVERQLPETFGDMFRLPDKFGDRYLYGICVVEAFAGLSLRNFIKDTQEYKTLVQTDSHLEHFKRLIDRECFDPYLSDFFNDIDGERENYNCSIYTLSSVVKDVVQKMAQHAPELRVTFAEISNLWQGCDQSRMEAERLFVLVMLENEEKEVAKLKNRHSCNYLAEDNGEASNSSPIFSTIRATIPKHLETNVDVFLTANENSLCLRRCCNPDDTKNEQTRLMTKLNTGPDVTTEEQVRMMEAKDNAEMNLADSTAVLESEAATIVQAADQSELSLSLQHYSEIVMGSEGSVSVEFVDNSWLAFWTRRGFFRFRIVDALLILAFFCLALGSINFASAMNVYFRYGLGTRREWVPRVCEQFLSYANCLLASIVFFFYFAWAGLTV